MVESSHCVNYENQIFIIFVNIIIKKTNDKKCVLTKVNGIADRCEYLFETVEVCYTYKHIVFTMFLIRQIEWTYGI